MTAIVKKDLFKATVYVYSKEGNVLYTIKSNDWYDYVETLDNVGKFSICGDVVCVYLKK